jgi:pyruvate/2-oxoglutarate dehydrogenase complex dihydrolipoamide dehydrogenase (E3) component
VPYLTNTSMMALDVLPEHLIVVGGSYIGLEFGQMYRRFGSRVTVVEYEDRLIAREDPDICDAVADILRDEGIDIRLGVRDMAFAANGEKIRLSAVMGNAKSEIEASHLLVAVGRRPNTADLGLDAAGVRLDKRGFIEVDDELRTNVTGIWAMGDVNGRGAFTHTSYNDYEIVAANVLDHRPRRVSDRIMAYALFTDPPLGRIGMSEAEVRARGRPALKGHIPMSRVGRARERGETTGFIKVYVDQDTKQLIGAALLGIEADEVVQALLTLMATKAPYTAVNDTMYIHPTVTELLPTVFESLQPLA